MCGKNLRKFLWMWMLEFYCLLQLFYMLLYLCTPLLNCGIQICFVEEKIEEVCFIGIF
jgi:hypothetical protein